MSDQGIPKISVRGLKKSFGPKRVLDGIEIDCAAGESLVIIGGSGTGKSVLIKCILGLLRPDAGSIRIDGVETVGMRTAERETLMRKFGMLFQGGAQGVGNATTNAVVSASILILVLDYLLTAVFFAK